MSKSKRAPWPKKAKIISLDLYGVSVVFTSTEKDFNSATSFMLRIPYKEHIPTGEYQGVEKQLTRAKTRKLVCVIGVFNGAQNVLVHECAHAAFDILSHVGIPTPTDSANEAFAYLIDYLFAQFSKHVKLK